MKTIAKYEIIITVSFSRPSKLIIFFFVLRETIGIVNECRQFPFLFLSFFLLRRDVLMSYLITVTLTWVGGLSYHLLLHFELR